MNLNYDFESFTPPKITEDMLLEEIKKRKLRKDMLLAVIISTFLCIDVILLAISLLPVSRIISIMVIIYLLVGVVITGFLLPKAMKMTKGEIVGL